MLILKLCFKLWMDYSNYSEQETHFYLYSNENDCEIQLHLKIPIVFESRCLISASEFPISET